MKTPFKRSLVIGTLALIVPLLFAGSIFAQDPIADIEVTAANNGSEPVTPGVTDDWSVLFTVTNNGPDQATNVVVLANLVIGGSFTGFDTCSVEDDDGGNFAFPNGPWNIASLDSGNSVTVEYTCTILSDTGNDATVDWTFTLDSLDQDQGDNVAQDSDSISTTFARESDLSIIKSDDEVDVPAGTNLTYTFNIENLGPSDAAAVTVVDTLPAGTSYVSNTAAFDCTPDTPSAGQVECLVGIVGDGGTPSFELVVAVDPSVADGTILNNVADVSSDSTDPVPGNNTDTEATTVDAIADLSIVKTADPDPVGLGAQLTFTFEVDNFGPSDAQNVQTVDDLPAVFEGQVASMPAECADVAGDIVCNWGTLPAGTNTSFDIVIDVPAEEFALGPYENAVLISSTTTDPVDVNNVSDVISQVVIGTAAEGTAILVVQKFFTDFNNVTPITLNLQCTNGQPNQSSVTVSPTDPLQIGGPLGMYEVAFVIDNIAIVGDEGATCTVTEEPVAGYTTGYVCLQEWSMSTVGDSCFPQAFWEYRGLNETTACEWSDIQADDANFCFIQNDQLPVEVSVTKDWDVTSAGGDFFDRSVDVTIWCTSEIVDGYDDSPYYYKEFSLSDSDFVDGEETVTALVYPNFERTDPTVQATYCWATENINDSAVEIESDCGDVSDPGMKVSAGNPDSCTITNTLFFEGIPTLSQYGMAIMALLMLGIGLVGFRRFA
jgi:uncharacterized repeat protein (TIGR01451 family)